MEISPEMVIFSSETSGSLQDTINSKNINIINGGRYNNLISDLGSKKQVPAVGAAINII